MHRFILAAGVAAAAITTTANAQETCEQRRDNRTVGTVAGAGIGAVLGGVIGGNGLGAVLGAVGGGVAGNQLAKGPADCQHAYGYYDNRSQWHANRVDPAAATGYYDRDGRWVVGAPAGSYDRDGRWVAGDASRGYRDRNGYWVPANANGYYAADGAYVTAQPVYGDNRGYTQGDNRGYGQGDNRGYGNQGYGNQGYNNGNQPGYNDHDFRTRIARTDERIDRAVSDGTMTQDQASRARRDLHYVNLQAGRMPHYRGGGLSPSNQRIIDAKLDEINGRIRETRQEARGDRSNY